ncbi:putative salicylate hydroxylase [Rhizodiscina lignyota]|uniref:Salicylate hydroxylase n=1 Tax=Rhizodiscina lignyota TaxID=1504668 RepID=A0A9P4M2Q8_9PEZI|nr:putative salicylate hydroxylase [Rhizodiscina lignyota]
MQPLEPNGKSSRPLRVVIVGAGLGGLACGIACRQQGLEAVVIERAPEILEIGAGIQLPPNAVRTLDRLGVLDAIRSKATETQTRTLRRWKDGKILAERDYRLRAKEFGYSAMVIHRADYQRILLDQAIQKGVRVRTGCEVKRVDFDTTEVILDNGESESGDVIVSADGVWSTIRNQVLTSPVNPEETGDLAYRGTIPRETLDALHDKEVDALCSLKAVTLWLGPEKHAVFYPVRGGKEFNLVLLKPDDLTEGTRTEVGDIEVMRQEFVGWDPAITKIISCFPSVLKWRLVHHGELETWTKNNVVLLGDCAHPTLPYQAQGAAMAVEDAVILGYLLGRFSRTDQSILDIRDISLPQVLKLYEKVQKPFTTINVRGADQNREMYHLPDGKEQEERDAELANWSWNSCSKWIWIDGKYQHDIMGSDRLEAAIKGFDNWINGENGHGQRPAL